MLEAHSNSHKKKKVLYIDDPLRLGERIKISDVCPRCSSFFVSKGQCDSCGFQLFVDIIGEPFSERSFFTLKEDFQASLSKLDYLQWSFLPEKFLSRNKVKRYTRFLLKRYSDLVEFLASQQLLEIPVSGEDHVRLFLFEIKEIMKDYCRFNKDLSDLSIPLKRLLEENERKDALSKDLMNFLNDLNNKRSKAINSMGSGDKSISNWNLFKEGILFEALIAIGAVTLTSYLVLKYLTL